MKKMMSSTVKMQHQHHYHRKSISQHRFVAVILTLIGLLHGVHCEIDETLSIARGSTVPLECPIDIQSCGSLHSLKWFRGNDRVALVPGDGGTPNVDGPYRGRITIDPDGSHTKLYIKSVQVHDEDTYKCVVTYSDPLDSCESKGLYIIKLNVLVEPSTMQMQDETGQILQNETVVGPLIENERFVSYCEARMGRPRPNVGWYLHGKRLPESISTSEGPDANGLFTEKAMLSMILTRKEMAATFECRIESEALQTIKRYQLKVDLQVRPRKVEVSGVRTHTVQGSTVSLLCKVFGARPAANVTWYNNTTPLRLDGPHTINEKSEEISDTTFTTYSQLSFTATRYENGVNFRCEADNIVMQNELEKPLSNFLYLTVMYPPVVTVSPSNLLVTENGDIYLDCRYDSNPSSLKRVTWKRNGVPLVVDGHRMGGGNVESIGLKIQQVLRTDLGNYTCELQNEYGIGVSDNSISLDVHYPPVVELLMEPDTPIIEHDAVNVTLICRIISGNPATLSRVTWYLDGGILKELPECNGGSDDALCGVDPDILLLENVGRHFLGNYSCEGQNTAGGGNRSVDRELIVYYEPGKATLLHYPLVTSKKKSVTLFCSVEDGGNPNATQYKWLRSGSVLQYDTAMITLENLGLESRTNFTCYAYNKGGIGQSATIALDVLAPPAFIKALQPRTAALFSTQNISLSCRVECVPLCTITWYKNGIGIEKYDERYVITDTFLPADKAIGDFESVLSTLHFNISAWPKQQLDIHQDNANYSCVSSANSEGPGVRSSTVFHVEYPPENTTVSNVTVDVIEGNSPPRITCAGNAYPPLQYQWIRNGTVIDGSLLQIHKPMTREDAGIYECVSRNKHGTQSASIEINILYKPDCTITRREINDEDTLVCTANGNPAKMSFEWTVKMENETEIMPESSTDDSDTVSLLTINDDKGRTYRCIANNSVGIGTMCNIEITGQYHWWQHWNTNPMIIIIAAVTALLLMVIIICCIIICICRKRRQRDKSRGKSSLGADLLTDPGEYENLPFHGLQTAPNKFYTPANATHGNVVRVAPRQKTTTSATSSSSTLQTPPTYCYNLAHSFPSSNSNSSTNTATNLSTYPNFLHINSSNNSTATTTATFAGIAQQHHQQQQQQQQQQHKTNNHFNSSQVSADCNNAIVDNDPIKSTAVQNPFLAKRPKSLNQIKRNLVRPPPPPPPPPPTSIASSAQHHAVSFSSLSMPRTKSIAMHCTMADKKFNSLKSMSARKTPQFYSLRLNKCRRHQTALTNPTFNTQQKLLVINNSTMPYLHSSKSHHSDSDAESTSVLRKLTFNQQPLYENLVNASLEYGSTVIDGFYCEANDANSIYRSDSGISNSSYELTPVPAPRNNPRNCQSAPVYMNLPKYASICGTGTNSKYRAENNITTTPNTKLGFATTAFNYERFMPTNPFTTSSRRQQILVPKELFPRKNNGHDTSISSASSSSNRRPVKLPLRKHHSFHFQPSQTVAGVLKHEQFQQQQSKHYHHHKQQQQVSTKERYKNQGPLVFKPFSEKSAFKPIIPSPKGSNDSEDNGDNLNDDNHDERYNFDTLSMPRICGTSLKRHISNVETFSKLNQWQSDNEESFQNSTNKMNTMVAAPSSVLTVNRRKIHYADLAPLPTHNNVNSIPHHRNDRNNNSDSNEDNVNGTTSNTNSEWQTACDAQNAKGDHKPMNNQLTSSASASSSTATATQYATLRFDEISI